MRVIITAFVALLAGFQHDVLAATGADQDATAIVQRSDDAIKPHTEKAFYQTTLIAANGSVEQERTFEVYYKRDDGDEKTLQKFMTPPVLAGTGLLLIDKGQPDTDTWLYLPTTRRIRRIAGHDKSGRYMGTEFSYEDLEGYRIAYHHFTYVGEQKDGNGRDCYIIDSVATAPSVLDSTGYSKKRYWIDRATLYPVRIEYYAKDGKLEKQRDTYELHKVGSYWRPGREEMKNLLNGRVTKLKLVNDVTDASLDDRYVSQRYLRSE